MSKEPKENKSRPEVLRQPQRKDSLSSVLSWAGLQTKPGLIKSPANPATTSTQSQSSSPGNIKSRRHSYGPDGKKKARDGSVTSRRLSLSNAGGTPGVQGAKTRHTKAGSTVDSRNTDGVSVTTKTGKSSSTEKVNKQTQDGSTESIQKPLASSSSQEKTSSIPERPTSPKIIPKSILRVSSPDGQRPPRRIIAFPAPPANTENSQKSNSAPSPLSPLDQPLPGIAEDDAPGSPPSSPIARPLSPGATVRFAKATIHRVEVGPGRRFAPVKRKSKSTLTYIAPLDPGAQKATPKNMLASPTKLRRHVENQKAMGRYWMRTEEEEAQWRAEAAMRAAEEAERYRAEPASPPGPAILANSPAFHGFSWADGLEAQLDKLPPIDSLPTLDKLETEEEAEDKLETVMSDSDDSDTESPDSGAKIFPMDGDQEDHHKQPIKPEKEHAKEAKTNADSPKGTEAAKQNADETSQTPSSTDVKTGGDGAAQEVKQTTATSNATVQGSETTPTKSAITTTTTSGASKTTSIPSLTLSRPTSPSPRRISSHRALSPSPRRISSHRTLSPSPSSPSRPMPSKSLSTTAIIENTPRPERPHTPSARSASANHLHLSGRRGGSSGRRHEIAA
ncbi:hypothetical protein QBC37DRAFT_107813 [Rhypophila decipiens]|uniref:Uncharacterized protein n=1 Tax=Rhypophila decipiens TaxID=261697 RepID=A0AAN6YMP7_9PEZI|nr:hypothetical protein QBC37DRAFT_107813 [Rhypophila decipiens]